MIHHNDPVLWEYEVTGMDELPEHNPHYHCSTLDRTPCPTGEHRNPATQTERPAPDA